VTPDSYRDNSLSAFGGKGLKFLDFCNTFIKKYERKEESNDFHFSNMKKVRERKRVIPSYFFSKREKS
jgi:hypothetical protein